MSKEELQIIRNIIEFAESRERVMKEQKYPLGMAIQDLFSTIKREMRDENNPHKDNKGM